MDSAPQSTLIFGELGSVRIANVVPPVVLVRGFLLRLIAHSVPREIECYFVAFDAIADADIVVDWIVGQLAKAEERLL